MSQERVVLGKRITGVENLGEGGERVRGVQDNIAKSCCNEYDEM